ncbi:MAG: aldehyde dehydrogenase family protein, partial [Rhodanobacter sp.]
MSAQASEHTSTTTICHYIGGQQRAGSGATVPSHNPASGTQTGAVALATPDEVDAAIRAADAAFPAWAQTPPLKRARVMFRFKELLERDMHRLAAVITREHGKV